MNKIISLIIAAFFTCITAKAQWTKISSGTGRQLNQVFFPSKNVGYIVPYNGLLRRTLDGGKSWDSLYTMEFSSGSHHAADNDIFFLNDSLGFISTLEQHKPKVYKTTDGGSTNTWEDITPDSNLYSVPRVQFLNANTGYLFANNGWDAQVWKTIDGGKTWTDLAVGINVGSGTGNMPSMFFTDENTGYLTGGDGSFMYRGIIARTTDGGKNWSVTMLPQYSVLNSIHFPNKDTGYVVSGISQSALVFRTINGGDTWDSIASVSANYGPKLFFADGKTGFLISNADIYKTTNAGVTWTAQNPGITTPMHDIFFIDKNTGYVVGDSGLVLKTTNGGVSGIRQNYSAPEPTIFPNPSGGIFHFRIDSDDTDAIQIFDGLGHMILTEPALPLTRIDLGTQPAGIYYYRIIGKKISAGKLIKN